MEPFAEERNEPRVEIDREWEEATPRVKPGKDEPSTLWKKTVVGGAFLLGLAGLFFGLWRGIPETSSGERRQGMAPNEIAALKNELTSLKTELASLKNEVQSLKESAKIMAEPVRGLKDAPGGTSSPDAVSPRPSPPAAKSSKAVIYRIRKGDTLASVAKRFQTNPRDLRRWNRLSPNDRLLPGRTLIVRPANP